MLTVTLCLDHSSHFVWKLLRASGGSEQLFLCMPHSLECASVGQQRKDSVVILYPLGLLYILATEQDKVVSRLASGLIGLVGHLEAENLEESEPYRW
jgi:hypothetical protein